MAGTEAMKDRIVADRNWMRTIDAAFMAGGVDEAHNRIAVEISSANPAAAALLAARYGLTPDELRVTSDGTGIQLQPRGTVRGRIVRADGTPPGDNGFDLAWTSDHPGSGAGECGSEVGMGVAADGRFVLPCAPGGWTIRVQVDGPNGWQDIGHRHVVVPPGLAVDVVICLDP